MKPMIDIEQLLTEAETGKVNRISERITDEAKPFWDGVESKIISGTHLKPFVVSRLLREHFGIKISESAIRNHFAYLLDNAKK